MLCSLSRESPTHPRAYPSWGDQEKSRCWARTSEETRLPRRYQPWPRALHRCVAGAVWPCWCSPPPLSWLTLRQRAASRSRRQALSKDRRSSRSRTKTFFTWYREESYRNTWRMFCLPRVFVALALAIPTSFDGGCEALSKFLTIVHSQSFACPHLCRRWLCGLAQWR